MRTQSPCLLKSSLGPIRWHFSLILFLTLNINLMFFMQCLHFFPYLTQTTLLAKNCLITQVKKKFQCFSFLSGLDFCPDHLGFLIQRINEFQQQITSCHFLNWYLIKSLPYKVGRNYSEQNAMSNEFCLFVSVILHLSSELHYYLMVSLMYLLIWNTGGRVGSFYFR